MMRAWLTALLLLAAVQTSAGSVLFFEDYESDTVPLNPTFGTRGLQTNVSCTSFDLTVNSTAPISGTKDLKSTSLNSWYVLSFQHLTAPADAEISVDSNVDDCFVFLRSDATGLAAYFFRHIRLSNQVQFGKAFTSANTCPVPGGPHPVVSSSILIIAPPINPGGVRTLKFRIEGTQLTGFLNDTQVIQTTDASISGSGFFGIGGIKTGQFDNVLLTDLAVPPGLVPTGQSQAVTGGFKSVGAVKAVQ